jgi:hypothetical protein
MHMSEGSFHIKKKNVERALIAVQSLPNKQYSWVGEGYRVADNLKDALDEWRWEIAFDGSGDVDDIWFNGQKLGDDETLWMAIAPYVEPGSYIDMIGEDSSHWRWFFDGVRVEELSGEVVFESPS